MQKRIRDFENYIIDSSGYVINERTGRVLKPDNCRNKNKKNPYLRVVLSSGNKQTKFVIHRLVAEYFCENNNTKNKTEVNHKDGNRYNNDYTNLEWVSPQENRNHAEETGLVLKGIDHGNSIYSENQVLMIKDHHVRGLSRKESAELAGTTLSFVKDIRSGRAWKHI